MLKHAAAEGAGARVSGGFVVVMPAARLKVASAVVGNAIIAGAPGAVTLVDRWSRRGDKQLRIRESMFVHGWVISSGLILLMIWA